LSDLPQHRPLHDSAASFDVAIIGAGPAGLSAADVLRRYDLGVVVVDEQHRPGGQILRQPPQDFRVQNWLPAKLYDRVKSLLYSLDGSDEVSWSLGTTVLGMMEGSPYRTSAGESASHEVWLQRQGRCEVLHAKVVLLAAGCYERPLPFPGWTLPGVMGTGAIQGFVKSQQLVPGSRFLLVGHHPLQLIVADQLLSAGADVAAVAFTQSLRRAFDVLKVPVVMARHGRQLMETAKVLTRLKRAGVPVLFETTIVDAEGEHTVEQARIAPLMSDGSIDHDRSSVIHCDRIGTCHGFLVSSELARQAGAEITWKENEGGWLVDHDQWFESSVAKLFVAGEITGLAGADAALEKGHIAAIGILRALGRVDTRAAERLARTSRGRLSRLLSFARALNVLSSPTQRLLEHTTTAETILCRCESLSFGEVQRQLLEHPHVASADAAKLLTRAGMGICQGRFCGHNVAGMVARERGLTAAEVGTLHSQAPVKPVLLRTLQTLVGAD
jgi:thioredoxin reductase